MVNHKSPPGGGNHDASSGLRIWRRTIVGKASALRKGKDLFRSFLRAQGSAHLPATRTYAFWAIKAGSLHARAYRAGIVLGK